MDSFLFMEVCMKKKIFLISLLVVIGAGFLIGCSNKQNNNDGSNADSGNEHQTGVLEQIVTEAATDVKEAVTDVKDKLEEVATDAATKAKDALEEH